MEARPLSTAASKLKSNRVSAQPHSAFDCSSSQVHWEPRNHAAWLRSKNHRSNDTYVAEHIVDHRLHEFKCQPPIATQVRKTGQMLIKVPIELFSFADFSLNFYSRAVLGHISYDELIPSLNGF